MGVKFMYHLWSLVIRRLLGRSVMNSHMMHIEYEFVCPDCGYRCWDPELEIHDDDVLDLICPKCGVIGSVWRVDKRRAHV